MFNLISFYFIPFPQKLTVNLFLFFGVCVCVWRYISSSAGLSKQYALKHLHSTYCSLNECLTRKKGSQEQFPKASQEITKNYLKQTNSSTAIKTHSSPNLKNFFGFFKGTKISFFLIFNRSRGFSLLQLFP